MKPLFLLLAFPLAALALPNADPFDYTAAAAVTGLNGGSGWAGAWTQDGLTGTVRNAGLTWTDSLGNTLTTSGRSMTTAGTATTRNFRLVSSTPITECWISFLWQLPATNTLFEGVSLYTGTATAKFTVSNPGSTTGASLYFGAGGSGTVNTNLGAFGTTHFIVLHLRDNAGTAGADLAEMYIDPILSGTPTTPTATTQAADLSFNTIRVAGQNGAALLVDEIRFGATAAEVMPYTSVPVDPDPDRDGISTAQELLLGTNPTVSNLTLFNALRQHPEYVGLYSGTSLFQDTGGGSLRLHTPEVPAPLIFEIQTSPDLANWKMLETVYSELALPAGKSYLRTTVRP